MKSYSGIVALFIGTLLASCSAKSEKKTEASAPTLPVIQLTNQDATLDRDYASNLEAVQNVEVRARVAGFLDKILVDEGHPVRKVSCCFSLTRPTIRLK